MSTPTYTLIDSTTLASSASSVTFSSITQDYRDLILVGNFKATAFDSHTGVRFNGDTGNNYHSVFTSDAGTGSNTGSYIQSYGLQDTTIGLTIIQIMDYTQSKHKSVLTRGGTASVGMTAGRWASTSAITSVTVFGGQGLEWAAGGTFYLYGIEA